MTVKESFNVTGLPTTFGYTLWKDIIATENAFLIDCLLQADAIAFGKTNVLYIIYATGAAARAYNIVTAEYFGRSPTA